MEPVLRMRERLVQARDAAASMTAVFGLLKDVGAYERLQRKTGAFGKRTGCSGGAEQSGMADDIDFDGSDGAAERPAEDSP